MNPPPQDVVSYAAALLGVPAPPEEPFAEALLLPMAAEFYADKAGCDRQGQGAPGIYPAYPTYREGLRALTQAGEGRGE